MHARTLIHLLLLAAATLWASPLRAQTTLDLARTARVPLDEPIRLGAVASLEGEYASELAGLILVEDPEHQATDADGWFRIEISQIRATVEDRLGRAAGLVAIQGSACDVRVLGKVLPDEPEPTKAAPAEALSHNADGLIGLQTVRGAVARELSRILRTPPESLRLTFSSADAAGLDTSIVDRVVQVDPVGFASRMPVRVSVYAPNRLVLRQSFRVGVMLRREVALTTRAVVKGHVLTAKDLRTETRWVSPDQSFAVPSVALGAAAVKPLSPGQVIESRFVEPPVLIERGDPVMVRVILDGMVVRRAANAREPGRIGEVIEFSPQHDSKTRFRATVVGKGEAQVWTFEQTPETAEADDTPHQRGTAVASDTTAN